jgi:hypothetical protein
MERHPDKLPGKLLHRNFLHGKLPENYADDKIIEVIVLSWLAYLG